MTALRIAPRIAIRQARNMVRLASGRPVTTPSLGSMTLDQDDVDLAFDWLNGRSRWADETVVHQFEHVFAEWNGSSHAFAFMGGRIALSACIAALDLKPGDEVILPGYTCVVVPNAFDYAVVNLVYCDIELDTFGPSLDDIERKISDRTRAIMVHHLYGLVCRDYLAIIEFARRRGLYVIEDCCHATGAEFRGIKVGNLGDLAFYSSEQSKIFNTIGGGLATTNDDRFAHELRAFYRSCSLPDDEHIARQLRNVPLRYYQCKHPQRWWRSDIATLRYGRSELISTTPEEELGIRPAGYLRRMPAPIAALGLNQLRKVDAYNDRRRITARRWDSWCQTDGRAKPTVISESVPVFLRYPVLVEPHLKQDRRWAERDLGVTLGVWFISHTHPARRPVEGCPNADRAVRECINFPTLLE